MSSIQLVKSRWHGPWKMILFAKRYPAGRTDSSLAHPAPKWSRGKVHLTDQSYFDLLSVARNPSNLSSPALKTYIRLCFKSTFSTSGSKCPKE
jgi:hypothetical protein